MMNLFKPNNQITVDPAKFESYEPFVYPYDFSPMNTDYHKAREIYDVFIEDIPFRLEQLSKIAGFKMNYKMDSIPRIWWWLCPFLSHFEIDNKKDTRDSVRLSSWIQFTPYTAPEVYSIIHDIGIYISEVLIKSSKGKLGWEFLEEQKVKSHMVQMNDFYNYPVLKGFSKAKSYPKFVIFEDNLRTILSYRTAYNAENDVEQFRKVIPEDQRADDPISQVFCYWYNLI
jgi:hypothetical protein